MYKLMMSFGDYSESDCNLYQYPNATALTIVHVCSSSMNSVFSLVAQQVELNGPAIPMLQSLASLPDLATRNFGNAGTVQSPPNQRRSNHQVDTPREGKSSTLVALPFLLSPGRPAFCHVAPHQMQRRSNYILWTAAWAGPRLHGKIESRLVINFLVFMCFFFFYHNHVHIMLTFHLLHLPLCFLALVN
jgi:hypothetical protein